METTLPRLHGKEVRDSIRGAQLHRKRRETSGLWVNPLDQRIIGFQGFGIVELGGNLQVQWGRWRLEFTHLPKGQIRRIDIVQNACLTRGLDVHLQLRYGRVGGDEDRKGC
jgi:hypothetical protein